MSKTFEEHWKAFQEQQRILGGEGSAGRIRGRPISEVKPEAVEWLWKGYVASGKLTVIDGDPGLGKSTLALHIAARLTVGGTLPGDAGPREPRNVFLLTGEDGLADTVRPRLEAMGADLNRVHTLDDVVAYDKTSRETRLFQLPDDVDKIAKYGAPHTPLYTVTEGVAPTQEGLDPVLLIIDPLAAFVSPTLNMWKDQDARRALLPLAKLAEAANLAIILIRHLTKKEDGQPIYRGGGSIGIIAAARAGFVVAKDPDRPEVRVLASVKNNLGPTPPSLAFHIAGASNGSSLLEWEGESEWTAESLLGGLSTDPSRQIDQAVAFLEPLLKARSHTVPELRDLVSTQGLGFDEKTLARARVRMGADVHREGFGKGAHYVWSLPSIVDQEPADSVANNEKDRTLENSPEKLHEVTRESEGMPAQLVQENRPRLVRRASQ